MMPLVDFSTLGASFMADYVENFDDGGNITSDWWPAGSRVKLLRVNWDSSYRDVVIFDSVDDRNTYFDGLGDYFSYTVENMSYLKPSQAIKVPIPYSTAYTYNYIEVINPRSPKYEETRLYYFISRADYVAPSTTLLTLQLDVMMSYQDKCELGSCFVERGHVAMANVGYRTSIDAGNYQYAQRRYLDVPEGLDVGSDYVTVDSECFSLSGDEGYYMIIMSTADLTADPGSINAPNLKTAGGGNVASIPSGCNVYAMDADEWISWLRSMSNYPWVTQCIIAAYSFPKRYVTATASVSLNGKQAYVITGTASKTLLPSAPQSTLGEVSNIFSRLKASIDAAVKHDKFTVFPYSFLEITANTGVSVLLKPQYVVGDTLFLASICCALYPFAKIGVVPWNYGGRGAGAGSFSVAWSDLNNIEHVSTLPRNEALSNALWLSNFPMFSIVNNSYLTYMASTAYSRAYSYEAAGWQLARTNMATQLSYEQAQGAMATSQANQTLANNLNRLQMGVNLGTGLVGAGSQLLGGNIGGAAAGAANALLGAAMGQASYDTQNRQFANSISQAQYVASSNRELAQQAASGDYEMAIKSINSAVQDAALTPPSQVGQMGGDVIAQANGLYNVMVNFKMITRGPQNRIADFWSRYGYQVNEFVQGAFRPLKQLKVMTRFSYWKMRECYLQSPHATEEELLTIKGILERGVTVWNSPAMIGSPSLDYNQVDDNKEDWGY